MPADPTTTEREARERIWDADDLDVVLDAYVAAVEARVIATVHAEVAGLPRTRYVNESRYRALNAERAIALDAVLALPSLSGTPE